ncbi:MAG: right-handed parallel beta-helix repeat-containing protein [Treponema sp.]|nr:right-handed parallel beta-helix repeat-containing protein [Treponema sp.]
MKVFKTTNVLAAVLASSVLFFSCTAISEDGDTDAVASRASTTTVTVSTESALKSAVNSASAGTTIVLGSDITLTSTLQLLNSGTSSSRIYLNGNGKTLTCNFSSGWGIKVNGSYWTVHNLTITKSPDCGIVLQSGTHVNLLYVKATWNGDSGIQVYNGASYAYVYKCESYYNYDSANGGENADGYACKLSAGAGNRFVGCIAAYNSDDGWDLYGQPYTVTMTDCTAKYNGYYPTYGTTTENGDGNGFKLGSSGQSVSHTLSGCSSYNNLLCGYDGNGNTGSMSMTNCTASGNGYANYYRIY